MWFDDEEVTGRRLFLFKRRAGRKAILKVNNTRWTDKKSSQRLGAGVLLAGVVVAVTACLWLGFSFVGRALFSTNNRFVIKNLVIQEGTVINRELIEEYTQIKEGMNLFAFDIAKVRKDFVRQSPNVKSMEISRQIPDTLKISVVERVPVARIGRKSPFVADGEGYIFGLRSGYRELPVVTGYRDPGLRPGSRLCGMSLAALEVLEACYDSKIGLHVDEVDINNPEYLVLYIPDGEKVKEVDLSWQDMGKLTGESKKRLQEKLLGIVQTLQSPDGRRMLRINATLEGKLFASGG